jgi:hypothetical protein
LITTYHACTVKNLGEQGEYKSQRWVENTNVIECSQEIYKLFCITETIGNLVLVPARV